MNRDDVTCVVCFFPLPLLPCIMEEEERGETRVTSWSSASVRRDRLRTISYISCILLPHSSSGFKLDEKKNVCPRPLHSSLMWPWTWWWVPGAPCKMKVKSSWNTRYISPANPFLSFFEMAGPMVEFYSRPLRNIKAEMNPQATFLSLMSGRLLHKGWELHLNIDPSSHPSTVPWLMVNHENLTDNQI